MKKLTQLSVLLLGLMVVFAGCDSAKKAAEDAKNNAEKKVKEMADIDFGNFDMKALQEKFSSITDGFKDVTTDNVDGLASKVTDLSGYMEGLGIDKLPDAAKTAVVTAIGKFADSIKSAMEGISDEGILGKLKPVVATLMEKLDSFK